MQKPEVKKPRVYFIHGVYTAYTFSIAFCLKNRNSGSEKDKPIVSVATT